MLSEHNGDIKTTWKILNKIVRKNQNPSSIPKYFIDENNKKVTNINEIANGFNDFFANIGPKLANKIKTPDPN